MPIPDGRLNDILKKHSALVADLRQLSDAGENIWDKDFQLSQGALEVAVGTDSKHFKPELPAPEQLDNRYIWVAATACLSYDLGYTKGSPPKTKCCPLRCKDWYVYATVRVCHPAAQEIWEDIVFCLKVGVVSAGLGAIIANAPGAIAGFKAGVWGCLYDKGYTWAKDISLDVQTDTRDADHWRRC